jgi:hypothetical protein
LLFFDLHLFVVLFAFRSQFLFLYVWMLLVLMFQLDHFDLLAMQFVQLMLISTIENNRNNKIINWCFSCFVQVRCWMFDFRWQQIFVLIFESILFSRSFHMLNWSICNVRFGLFVLLVLLVYSFLFVRVCTRSIRDRMSIC